MIGDAWDDVITRRAAEVKVSPSPLIVPFTPPLPKASILDTTVAGVPVLLLAAGALAVLALATAPRSKRK